MQSSRILLLLLIACISHNNCFSQAELTASEVIKKADDKLKGNFTSFSIMNMQIIRPTWQRNIILKSWSKTREYSLTLVTAPKKEEGQTFLKRGNEMWNWNPTIKRMIKLPPTMLSQEWMGSDLTINDLLNQVSLVNDFSHIMLETEIIQGNECYTLELKPKENVAVVWGRVKMWISKRDFVQLKVEFYDEDNQLVKTERACELKKIGGRLIPTGIELVQANKPGNKTVVKIEWIEFNRPISDEFFSQQNMKNVK